MTGEWGQMVHPCEEGIVINLIVTVIAAEDNVAEAGVFTVCFGMLSSRYWT